MNRHKRREIGQEQLIHKIASGTNEEEKTVKINRLIYEYGDSKFSLRKLIIVALLHYLVDFILLIICLIFNCYYMSKENEKSNIYLISFIFGLIVLIVSLIGNYIQLRNEYGLFTNSGFYINDHELNVREIRKSPSKKCVPFWLVIFIGVYTLVLILKV